MFTVSVAAQVGAPDARTVRVGVEAPGGRPQLTPEQQAEAAKRREAEMNAPRPIAALDKVWTGELTWMEVRDAIRAGKTTGLILTGGVESNGPHLATGKHNFILKVMAEAIAKWRPRSTRSTRPRAPGSISFPSNTTTHRSRS